LPQVERDGRAEGATPRFPHPVRCGAVWVGAGFGDGSPAPCRAPRRSRRRDARTL